MAFRTSANIDNDQHKGLVLSNSVTNAPLIQTGLSLTNSQPAHVALVDGTGSQTGISTNPLQIADSSGTVAQDLNLVRMMNYLVRPIYYNPTNNTVMVSLVGTLTTVTTVTTVTSISQLSGFSTELTLQFPIERTLWTNAIRSNIT